jgi:hypothetical protein
VLLDRLSYLALTLGLLKIERRVSPADRTNIELLHRFDVEVNLVGVISVPVNILKVNAMQIGRISVDVITPKRFFILRFWSFEEVEQCRL